MSGGGGVDLNPFNSPLFKSQGQQFAEKVAPGAPQVGASPFMPQGSQLPGQVADYSKGIGGPAQSYDPMAPGVRLDPSLSPLSALNDQAGMLDAGAQQQAAQAREQAEQQRQKAEQDARRMAETKNTDYLGAQAKLSADDSALDAMTRARNAARKAKGQGLFGAWEG